MDGNVYIKHYQHGKLVEDRYVHNVLTAYGRLWLSQLVAYSVVDQLIPTNDVPERAGRLRYFGVGIGSIKAPLEADGPDFIASYPVGADPHATNGHKYRTDNPTGPLIGTLERPVRIQGSQDPYPGQSTDIWMYSDLLPYFQDNQSVTFRTRVNCATGEIVYGTFTQVPISEAALFTDDVDVDVNVPYSPVAAYVHFDAINLTVDSIVLFSWSIRFRP